MRAGTSPITPRAELLSFLTRQRGYYCVTCLARRFLVSEDEMYQGMDVDFDMRYRLCHGCHMERCVLVRRIGT